MPTPLNRKQLAALSPGLRKIRTTHGMQSELARHLGISRQAIADWPAVPVNRLAQVEAFTGIDRKYLRPDIFNYCPPRRR